LAVVLGSRNPFAVFHISLNPLPALTMNIWFNVWKKEEHIQKCTASLYQNYQRQHSFCSKGTVNCKFCTPNYLIQVPFDMYLSGYTCMHPCQHMHDNMNFIMTKETWTLNLVGK
jgi:hypothetical protein